MTEQERRVERMMEHLDRLLLNGDIKQEDYDAAAREIGRRSGGDEQMFGGK